MHRLIALLSLIALALAGCGQAPAPATPIAAPAWKEFSGGGASLWLPDTYQSLDLGAGVDRQIARLEQFGGKYARAAELTRRSRRAFALRAVDTKVGYRTCAATVGVGVQLVRQETIALDRGAAVRMVVEFPGACRKEALYTVKRGDRFWMVVYAADAQEFERRLPSFERSIATFAAVEAPLS